MSSSVDTTPPAALGSTDRKKRPESASRLRPGCGWQTRDRETLPSRTAKMKAGVRHPAYAANKRTNRSFQPRATGDLVMLLDAHLFFAQPDTGTATTVCRTGQPVGATIGRPDQRRFRNVRQARRTAGSGGSERSVPASQYRPRQ